MTNKPGASFTNDSVQLSTMYTGESETVTRVSAASRPQKGLRVEPSLCHWKSSGSLAVWASLPSRYKVSEGIRVDDAGYLDKEFFRE